MKRIRSTWSQTAIVAALLATGGVVADAADLVGTDRARAEPYQRAKTPGPQHGLLAARQGEFNLTSRFWAAPGAEPEMSRLPARRTLVLGGRVLRLDVGPDSRWFYGTGLEGYDNVAGRFWYVWTDTTTTGLALLYGTLRPDGTGSYAGELPTPFGMSPLRVEIRRQGTAEIHDYFVPSEEGGERRLLELRYEPAGPNTSDSGISGRAQPRGTRGSP